MITIASIAPSPECIASNAFFHELQQEVVAMVEHALANRPGDWRVIIMGSQGSQNWEMKIFGPSAFEHSYVLEEAAGQHEPRTIAALVSRMLPGNM